MGERVRVQKQDKSEWTPGKIVTKINKPRTYLVKLNNGSVLERNRKFLIKDVNKRETPQLPSKDNILNHKRPRRTAVQPQRLNDFIVE